MHSSFSVLWGQMGSSFLCGRAEFMQFPECRIPGLEQEGTRFGLQPSVSRDGGSTASIIIFNRLLVEQHSFSLALANEKLLAGVQRKGTHT